MKLLAKNEIDKSKTAERQLEVNEGAKLARMIDELRRVRSEEESNLAKFRSESFKELRREVQGLEDRKVVLQADIKQLEKKFEVLNQEYVRRTLKDNKTTT